MSGFQAWASECVKTWDGYFVLRRFVGEEERRHPQELVRARSERTVVPIPRPEQADDFLSVNEVTAASL